EEKIGAAKLKRAAERRLKTHAVTLHPRRMLRGLPNRHAGELLVGEPACDLDEIQPVFLLGIRVAQHVEWLLVHRAHIARMAAVAAAESLRCRFDDQHSEAARARTERGAERGVAAAGHQQIVCMRRIHVSPGALSYRRATVCQTARVPSTDAKEDCMRSFMHGWLVVTLPAAAE